MAVEAEVNESLARISLIISQANTHEYDTSQLMDMLHQKLPSLHDSIKLPIENSHEALHQFVVDYIHHVPKFLEAISDLAQEAGIHTPMSHVMQMAANFFLNPPQLLESHSGMTALMDEAYLAHRLIEEINDRFINLCGQPLVPMDMTRSNLIIHYLIGEPFANELDSAVDYSVELIMAKRAAIDTKEFQAYIDEHKNYGWRSELDKWPCLAEDLSINLNFSETPSVLH